MGDCPPKKNGSIGHFSKRPKTRYVYLQVTKPFSGRVNYGGSKGGSQDRDVIERVRVGRRLGWMDGSTKPQTLTT